MNRFIRFLRFHWSRLTLRKRMILLYVAVVLLPSSFLLFMYYQKSSTVMQNEVQESLLQTLKQAELNISNRLNNVANVSNVLASNPLLYEYLTRYRSSDNRHQQFLDYVELEKTLDSLETTPYLHRIRLFINPNLLFAREHIRYFSLDDVKNDSLYEQVVNQHQDMMWTNTYRLTSIDSDPVEVVSAIRVLRDPENFDRVIGLLVLDIKEENLASVLTDINLEKEERISLISAQGDIISSIDKHRTGKRTLGSTHISPIKLSGQSGFMNYKLKDQMYSLMYQNISMNDWKLIAEIPKSALSGKSIAFNRIFFALVIVATLVIFIFIILLVFASVAEGMSSRIRKLVRTMKQEGLEHLDDSIAQTALSGEMSALELNISRMIQTVKALAEDSFQAKLQERESTLKALQAQINPHFLYNTLETINWMAIRHKASNISLMIDSLSKYFRLTLNGGRDVVTVQEEVALVRAYLDIQQNRFYGSFDTNYIIEDNTESLLIPKLTLQPIVENALMHGLRSRTQKNGIITIKISCEMNLDKDYSDLCIQVKDNGVGMSIETIKRLFQRQENELSYGLYNVSERIRLFSGEGYGIHIESMENIGTTVVLRLKAIDEMMSKKNESFKR